MTTMWLSLHAFRIDVTEVLGKGDVKYVSALVSRCRSLSPLASSSVLKIWHSSIQFWDQGVHPFRSGCGVLGEGREIVGRKLGGSRILISAQACQNEIPKLGAVILKRASKRSMNVSWRAIVL